MLVNPKLRAEKPSQAVAVVGVSCRLPGGVDSPEAFWRLLTAGRDAITEIPDDRWDKGVFGHPRPGEPGRAITFKAGTLGDVSGFDAAFFGISPREAEQMDPQQRLLLEMTWEAFERGGLAGERVAGTDCAVYVGISSKDYGDSRLGDAESGNAYFMLGNTLSIAANRISYVFDLHGPSMAVDTACSSSLVALHEAVCAVREGRAGMAVVGGISLLLSPFPFAGFSRASMLASYGQCRAFDRLAKGYVRAEGGVVLVLKPLAAAERDGDPIFGLIRGVGTNSDGRTHGIALPSPEQQEALLRKVYAEARIDPGEVSYVETHGTGTAVGDPAEAASIGRALGRHRATPLPIGSVKTNIGHLEPASGLAGVLKALLVARHRRIPASLNCDEPNPDIDFAGLNVAVAREPIALPADGPPAVIGINSFGFGGSNAHAVVQEYRPPPPAKRVLPETAALLLSARSEPALQALAARTADTIAAGAAPLYDIAWTAALRRSHHGHRLVARADDAASLVAALRSHAAGEITPAVESGSVVARDASIGLVFSGNGAQWQGMGVALLEDDAVFRATVERVHALVQAECGLSVLDELRAAAEDSRLDDTRVSQPLLFAVQVGLFESLRARGVVAAATAGHSVGEVAAAYAAGILELEQAVHVIVHRSAAQGETRGLGRMAAAGLSPERAAALAAETGGLIEVAAVNSPKAVTLSGDPEALTALGKRLKSEHVPFRLLDIDYAFHSRVLEPVRAPLMARLGALSPRAGALPFYSTVTGGPLGGERLDAGYWWDNVRNPVLFRQAIAAMSAAGINLLVEVGPHPIMQSYMRESAGPDSRPVSLVTRQKADGPRLQRSVDQLHVLGGRLDLQRLFPVPGRVADLPSYPWQRERHWIRTSPEARGGMFERIEHPLLGARPLPGVTIWERQLDTALMPFLADHVVGGNVLLPATAFIEMALEASAAIHGEAAHDLEMVEIRRPMVLDPERSKMVRFIHDPEDGTFHIESRTRMQDEPWSRHVSGRLSKAQPLPARTGDRTLPGPARRYTAEEHYALAERVGLAFGPKFRCVRHVDVCGGVAVAALAVPEGLEMPDAFQLHPSLLDSCLQPLLDVMYDRGTEWQAAYLPYQLGRMLHHGRGGAIAFCRVELTKATPRALLASFTLMDADGLVLAEMRDFRLRRVDLKRTRKAGDLLFGYHAVPLDAADAVPTAVFDAAAAALDAPAEAPPVPDFGDLAGAFAGEALISADIAAVPADRQPLLDRISAIAGIAERPAESLWRQALGAHPASLAELALLGRAGRHLPALLAGTEMPPAAGAALLEHFYEASPSVADANAALVRAFAAAVAAWPRNRRIRVLEIGGATLLARALLPLLPVGAFDYTLAVPSEQVGHAEAELGAGVAVVAFDPLAPLTAQDGLTPGGHDIVVSAHLLRRCGVPAIALEAAAALAAQDGLVLMSELAPPAWLSLALDLAAGRLPGERDPVPADAVSLHALADASGMGKARAVARGHGLLLAAAADQCRLAPADAAEATAEGGALLLFAAESGAEGEAAATLEAWLAGSGQDVLRVVPGAAYRRTADGAVLDSADPAAWGRLWRDLAHDGVAVARIVHLHGIGDAAGEDAAAMLRAQETRGWTTLTLVQSLAEAAIAPQLVLVTRDAVTAPELDGQPRPDQAPLWGLGRVLQNEQPQLQCRMIDLRPGDEPLESLARALAAELTGGDGEDETVITADGRYGLRLRPAATGETDGGGDTEVLAFTPGTLDSLRWTRGQRRAPGDGEVEIALRATGLNFRDVMFALGILPDEAVENGFAGATVGMEAAGIVTRVGPGVAELEIGQPVMCFAPACFASHVTTTTGAVAPLPAGIDFAAAATVPAVFFTVYYALHHLARLEKGERILIHGAAGGVGLAAVQFARHIGAEVFATAGSDEKRDLVRLAGVPDDHVLDSRSLAFDDQVMALTGGEGVDVVLNSLAGEAIHKSLGVLRPFGRFLELGKRDFYANTRLGLRPFRNNITYYGIDADQVMKERPALANRLFREMVALFEDGVFRPLPYRLFPRDRLIDAFRHMQQSRHVGKIVIEIPQRPAEAAAPATAPAIDGEAQYLVTGGFSGFGLATAEWLVERGARHLILVGRRGAGDEAGKKAVAELRRRGVSVTALACDVADEARLTALIAEATAARPLKGVVHAAAVFDDGILANMTREQFTRVLAPKVAGGWALHRATLGQPLDFFVLYSSVTTQFGNPGQANYVGANIFLEALAARRRAMGLPALAVCWGAIADVGYLSRNAEIRDSLEERLGAGALDAREALGHLERLLAGDRACVAVADMDWKVLRAALPALRAPKFGEIAAGSVGGDSAENAIDLQALIADMSPDEVKALLVDLIAEQVGHVLRISPDKLDPRQSVFDLGMDSLMMLELRMRIEESFGTELPAIATTEGASINLLAERIRDHLVKVPDEDAPPAVDASTTELFGRHDANVDQRMVREVVDQVAAEAGKVRLT